MLERARFRRSATGRRYLVLTVFSRERVKVDAKIVRSGHVLAHKRVASLTKGTHTITLPVPSGVRGGGARLALVYKDAAGRYKSTRKVLTVPARRA